jgi:hypothetical protein
MFLPKSRKFVIPHVAVFASFAASAGGTWQTTLEAVDLDPAKPGIEAYYDSSLNVTWLANVGAVQSTVYAWRDTANGNVKTPLTTFDNAQTWLSKLSVGQISGWRLPTPSEISSMFFQTLGNSNDLVVEPGPFSNLGTYRVHNDWIGAYLWTSEVNGPIITTFGMYGYGWNTALSGNPMIAWAVHDGKLTAPGPAISGTIANFSTPYTVICRNNTTQKTVNSTTLGAAKYDCAKLGLVVHSGDSVTITLKGTSR